MRERRTTNRWQVNKEAKIKLEGAVVCAACQLKDINFKGMQVWIKPQLLRDIPLKLTLFLADDYILELEVWVIWHKNIDGYNIYGLMFTRIRDGDKEKIYKFVYKHFPKEISRQWWQGLAEEEGGEKMEDRRVFARLNTELPLRYLDAQGNEGKAQACDISAKGLGVVVENQLAAHTSLELWLEIPDQGEPLYTRGEVVWSKRLESQRCRAGINLEKADLMGLSRVLRAE